MQSKVTLVSEDRIKEHFIKLFSNQNRSVSGRKKGGRGPLGSSPKSAYDEYKITPHTHSPQLNNNRGFKDPSVTSFLRILFV